MVRPYPGSHADAASRLTRLNLRRAGLALLTNPTVYSIGSTTNSTIVENSQSHGRSTPYARRIPDCKPSLRTPKRLLCRDHSG